MCGCQSRRPPCALQTVDATQGNKKLENPGEMFLLLWHKPSKPCSGLTTAWHRHTHRHTQSALQRQLSTFASHYLYLWPPIHSHNGKPGSWQVLEQESGRWGDETVADDGNEFMSCENRPRVTDWERWRREDARVRKERHKQKRSVAFSI